MAKVDGSLGALVQGVSQQPSRARLPGQSEEQINVTNDEVFGMSRRPGSTVSSISNQFSSTGFSDTAYGAIYVGEETLRFARETVDTGEPELRIVQDGSEYTVQYDGDAGEYMRSTEWSDVVFKEVGDSVLVVNRTVAPAMSGVFVDTSSQLDSSVIYCRGGEYAVGYTLRFDVGGVSHVVTYATPDGSDAAHTEQAQVRYIIKQLYDLITTPATPGDGSTPALAIVQDPDDGSFVADAGKYYASTGASAALVAAFDFEMVGEHLVVLPKTLPLAYSVTATESSGTELLVAVKDELTDVGRLPTRAVNDMVITIVGSNRSEDDYYMRWVNDAANVATPLTDDKGYWEETTAPYQVSELDPATMPHVLYFDGTDWRIGQAVWPARKAGDDDSNPVPAFIGEPISDVVDFQGRAVYLHGSQVSMSVTDEYFNWFKDTATANLDTDPVNLRSTSTKGASTLVYGVPFNRDLILFGTDSAQFLISGRSTVTNATGSIVLTSNFDMDLFTRPQPTGDGIMYISYVGKYAQLHEMYLNSDGESHARRTLTDHVPRYIRGAPYIFVADDGTNMAVIVSSQDPDTLYVYEYLWIDNRRVQSAWNKWVYPAAILSATIEDGELSLILSNGTGHIRVDSLLYREDADGLDVPVHLDAAVTQDVTDGTMTVEHFGGDLVAVQINGNDGYVNGDTIPIKTRVDTSAGGLTQSVLTFGKTINGDVTVGTPFSTRVVPTMPYVRDGDGVAVHGAEIALSKFNVTVVDTGPFRLTRECTYEDPADYWSLQYEGRRMGDPEFVLGSIPIASDTIEFPFDDQTTTSKLAIECDSHLPMTVTEVEWSGQIRKRSRRITNGG